MSRIDIPLTPLQVTLLQRLDQAIREATRDRDVACAAVVAGHGLDAVRLIEIDVKARVLRVEVAEEKEPKDSKKAKGPPA